MAGRGRQAATATGFSERFTDTSAGNMDGFFAAA